METILVGPELEENLSIRYLKSALLGVGHACDLLAYNKRSDLEAVARTILARNPGLVGLSLVAQRRYADFQRLVTRLRAGGYAGHITAGGHFASLRAVEVLRDTPGLDTILHHDGEERLVDLVHGLVQTGRPPDDLDGISWRAGDGTVDHRPPIRVAEIDSLAVPSRRRPDRALGIPRAPVVTSRGCAGSCSFCSIHAWHRQVPNKRIRYRSPSLVAEEMVTLHRKHGIRTFIFHDDDFIHPDRRQAIPRSRAILEAAAEGIGRPFGFVIKCRPDDVEHDLFAYLKSQGLVRVYVGIETGSALGIRTLNRRVTPEANEAALATLRQLEIYSCFNLLIFHPDSTLDELVENLDFLSRHRKHPFDIARTELYACSSLEERMVREGRAIGDYRGFDYRISDPRAERAFQLFVRTLWDRHFGEDSILHRSQDLGFRSSLLSHLYPEVSTAELRSRVATLIREVNEDTIEFMTRIAQTAEREISDASRRKFEAEMRAEVVHRLRQQSSALRAISAEMELRARCARLGLGRFSSALTWPRTVGRLAAAIPSVALLLGCDSCQQTEVCDPPPPPARFSTDIEPSLETNCALPECHSSEAASAGLVLESGSSYENLVSVPSTELPRLSRVEPGEPDSSYVVQKLRGTQEQVGGTGERMPKGGAPDYDLLYKMEEWIREGAKDD